MNGLLKYLMALIGGVIVMGGVTAVAVMAQYQIYLPIIIKVYEPEKGTILAYPNCEDLTTLNIGWYKNNQISPSAGCPAIDQRFVPRIVNPTVANTPALLSQAVLNARPSGWLLGYVEPNLTSNGLIDAGTGQQRAYTPQEGAEAWRKIEEEAAKYNLKLVAPSPSQHDPCVVSVGVTPPVKDCSKNPLGNTWIWEMIDAYKNTYGNYPRIDAFGWNFYERDPQAIINYLTTQRQKAQAAKFNGQYQNTPFWVLEYGGTCWDSSLGDRVTGNTRIMSQVTAWFKSTDWVTRYAWFANRIRATDAWAIDHQSCTLINPDTGAATSLGQTYAGY